MSTFRLVPVAALALLLASASAAFAESPRHLTTGEASFVATGDRCEQFLGIGPDTVDGGYTQQLVQALGRGDTGASLSRIYRACVAKLSVNTADRRTNTATQRH
jgi:hypothetical protein